MDENQEIEKLTGDSEFTDDKPMSEDDKEAKGLDKDVQRFKADVNKKHAAAVDTIAANNDKLATIRAQNDRKAAEEKEIEAKKARLREWATRDAGAIIAAKTETPKPAPSSVEEKVVEPV